MIAVNELSLEELERLSGEESRKFRAHQTWTQVYSLELFRRAIGEHDEDAWTCLYHQFSPLVASWVHHHPHACWLLRQTESVSFVNTAFARFAHAITPDKLAGFKHLAPLLHYIKHCVASVMADAVRAAQARACEETMEGLALEQELLLDDPAETVVSQISAHELWQVIEAALKSEEERLVMQLICVHDLPPREILRQHPQRFTNLGHIYRVKRNVQERLHRDRRVLAFLNERKGHQR